MFNLGMGEITIILLLALIFLGPKKLPELASGLGKLIREIRKTTSDVKNEIQLDDAIRKPFEELREAVTLHPEELKRRDNLRKELAELQRQAEAVVSEAEARAAESPLETSGDLAASDQGESAQTGSTDGSSDGSSFSAGSEGAAAGGSLNTAEGALTAESSAGGSDAWAPTTPPPVSLPPGIPGAAPVGTVARGRSGAVPAAPAPVGSTGSAPIHAPPPAPPLAAVLAKGSGPIASGGSADKRAGQPAGGSDFLRSLRAVPDGNRPETASRTPAKRSAPGKFGPQPPAADPNSAADRGNTTQALSEADLAAITVGPPPPPPPPTRPAEAPAAAGVRNLPPARPSSPSSALPPSPPPRLPGATPPKKPNR